LIINGGGVNAEKSEKLRRSRNGRGVAGGTVDGDGIHFMLMI